MTRQLDVPEQVILLLSLVPYLRENGPTPVLELARRFDVDAQTLRKLLQFLGTAGVPGETQTYQHEDLFDIDWDALEHHDVAHLIKPVAVDNAPRFAPAEIAALIAGLHSLTTMLPTDDAALAAQTAKKLATAFGADATESTITVTADPPDPHLIRVIEAIELGRVLRFTYRDSQGASTNRTVDPLRVTQGAESWYLRAHCHDRQGERTFRLDRMSNVEVTADAPQSPVRQEPSLTETDPEPEREEQSDSILLTVLVRSTSLPAIAGFDPEPHVGSEKWEGPPEGWLRVTVEVRYVAAAIHLSRQAPGNIIIEAPSEARDAVRSWAEEALAQYDL